MTLLTAADPPASRRCPVMRSILVWKRRTLGKAMVIGGVELYVMAYRSASASTSEIHAKLSGDTWFPDYDPGEWRERDRIDHRPDPANRYPYSFVVRERVAGGRSHNAAREAPRGAPHHYRDPCPAMAQSPARRLGEPDSITALNQAVKCDIPAASGLVRGLLT